MLYPKRKQPLSNELFKNPTSEYRGAPFWAWNCRLEREELLRQIEVLRDMGFGGFHMHPRTGMATAYLSGEYMELVSACALKARDEHMLAWLYDEDRCPSGAAGGIITQTPENRLRHLLLTRIPYGKGATAGRQVLSTTASGRTENGMLLACFDIVLGHDGSLADYRRIELDEEPRGFKLYAYMESAQTKPWFNNQTYADTLNPDTVAEFIRVTHERYAQYLSKDFGGAVPAIFTDEPQFTYKNTLDFAEQEQDILLPWTPDLPETFCKAYRGENLLEHLPELLWERETGVSRIRYLYHDHVAERFAAAFADQCGDWCRQHGLLLTGHMVHEASLGGQTAIHGEVMRAYRAFQLPGIDMLCDNYEYTTAKQAQSICRQNSHPGVLSELYGVTNWDFDFRGHKIQGDWQAALGVTVRVPHLSWVSMNGSAKRDYPSTFNYQSPWHTQYSLVENHFARINTAMTRGTPVVRVGVIHPVESCWLHWGPKAETRDIREQMESRFQNITKWLLDGLVDFDFIAESLLEDQCDAASICGSAFPAADMRYSVIIVPECETLRSSTLERLELFRNRGGRLIFLGGAPKYQDALPSDRGLKLYERSECISFERAALLNALENLRELEIRDSSGGMASGLLYQLREEDGKRWLFIAHSIAPAQKDIVSGDLLRICIRGEYACTLYDTISGDITALECNLEKGRTIVNYPLYDHDSLLLHFTKEPSGVPCEPPRLDAVSSLNLPGKRIVYNFHEQIQRWPEPVPITLEEPNVLLLDICEYKLDDGEYRQREEILRLDNILRHELGWPMRMEAIAQPWVEEDDSTPHNVTLRYTFHSRLALDGTKLALERPELASLRLNGAEVSVRPDGWYVDKCIQTVSLPPVAEGRNILEVTYLYGPRVDLEALYLIGDFGVSAAGCSLTLTPPVRELAFGDITRQGLPFYGGNLVYHLEAEVLSETLVISASCYRGQMIGVSVDGSEAGHIIYSPYREKIKGLSAGKHAVDLRLYGNRINTFGQLHCNNRAKGLWWGANSWRTVGEEWTYEYRFWEQGILKSPEIFGV